MKQIIGICLGAYSISCVRLKQCSSAIQLIDTYKVAHNGNPRQCLEDYIASNVINEKIVVTGRKFRRLVNMTNISETEASDIALSHIISNYSELQNLTAVASLGAETFLVYNVDNSGHIANVNTKNKCAQGTGEFFMQQIKRMDLPIEEAVALSENAAPYKVSGRCSVFCKSDCTHALNIGISKDKVCAGLALMIAEKITELLPHNPNSKILLVGGVTKNRLVVKHILQKYPNCIVPTEAEYFEALGSAIYGLNNFDTINTKITTNLFNESISSFSFHSPLNNFINCVDFKENTNRKIVAGESCILGLDVGSTTTKAVLLAKSDSATLADVYGYTNGNPIKATKECYSAFKDCNVRIVGLGTTGSGRHIAALHAQTTAIFNEITAHSNAAVFYDKDVDTIFEIGGQDAKYSYIKNLVPIDYAMNEACSAGTGSFIEEAAWESLGVKVNEIEQLAMQGDLLPNFSEQCAAFISSDIKTAQQENISHENIIAGLVYSICYNYLNRVKGNRPVGQKIFMQGGVCYNKAIPIAMAAVSGCKLIVPPNPGLMGALGVALEVHKRQQNGLLQIKEYNLTDLLNKEIIEKPNFVCSGGAEKCDLKCNISMIEIDDKTYPFGGICDKYSAINNATKTNREQNNMIKNYVQQRTNMLFASQN